jgi:hypothetical protein
MSDTVRELSPLERALISNPEQLGVLAVKHGVALDVVVGIETADPELRDLLEADGDAPVPDDRAEIALASGRVFQVDLWHRLSWVAAIHDDPGLVTQERSKESALAALVTAVEAVEAAGLL